MSKFGLPCAFLVKVILVDFQLEKYIQCNEKDVYIFSCSINVTVTSQNGVTCSLAPKSLYVVGLFTNLK